MLKRCSQDAHRMIVGHLMDAQRTNIQYQADYFCYKDENKNKQTCNLVLINTKHSRKAGSVVS